MLPTCWRADGTLYIERKGDNIMATLKDIAAACGVSVAAVSKALHDHPDISEETKRIIRSAAEAMGYAKAPVVKRNPHTCIAGLLITEDAETFFHQAVIHEVRRLLAEKGYDLVVLCPLEGRNTPQYTVKAGYLPRARLMRLEGILLFSAVSERQLYESREYASLKELLTGEKPVVSTDCRFGLCAGVVPAYEHGIRMLLRYAYGLGHRRIAFINGGTRGKENLPKAAFLQVCGELRLEVPRHYIRSVRSENVQDAYDTTLSLLRGAKWIRPTCILFGDEFLLKGGIAAVRNQGIRIPEEISIATLSFMSSSELGRSEVTSWEIEPGRIAEAAVETLLVEIHSPGRTGRKVRRVAGKIHFGETMADLWQK